MNVVDKKFEEARILFADIYSEFLQSNEFKEYRKAMDAYELTEEYAKIGYYMGDGKEEHEKQVNRMPAMRVEDIYQSTAYSKFRMKLNLLKAHLGIPTSALFPLEWYDAKQWDDDWDRRWIR